MRRLLATVLPLLTFGCNESTSFDPIADAGADRVVALGENVSLDGSNSSDPDGEISSYAWTLVSVPGQSTSDLAGQSDVTTSISVDEPGSYVVALTVWDDAYNQSAPDVVTITGVQTNERPVADLNVTGDLGVGVDLILDGLASSDPEGAPLEYRFDLLVAPDGSQSSLVPAADPASAFFTPDVEGYFVVGLTVNDGELDSVRDDRGFSVSFEINKAPLAVCGTDKVDDLGADVTLDGTGSNDAEGAPLTYAWSLETPDGSAAVLDDAASAKSAACNEIRRRNERGI